MRLERRVPLDVVKALEAKGHKVELVGESSVGNVQGILVNLETGTMTAGADLRRTRTRSAGDD